MTRESHDETDKISSPHPALQSVLPRLRALNPDRGREEGKPVFDNKAKARLFIDVQRREEGRQLRLTPVWAIDHTDLQGSDIEGWTVVRHTN
ncbi:MAG: hypothetical protein ACOCV2_09735 [Persicimonas sp.]